MVSPEAIHGGGAVAGHRLFDAPPRHHLTIAESPSLHLDVSVRSPRARRIGEWVNTILNQDVASQKETDSPSVEFPVVLTRDLETARAVASVTRRRIAAIRPLG